jgi:hypothetical protein
VTWKIINEFTKSRVILERLAIMAEPARERTIESFLQRGEWEEARKLLQKELAREAVAPIHTGGVAMRHVGPRDAT